MKWYQTIYAKIAGALALFALLGGLFSYIVFAVDWWKFESELPSRIESVEKDIDTLQLIKDYIDSKSQSYAVGFRVVKYYDESTGTWKKKKQYRDWNGRFNDIYVDHELTDFYGWDQFYYIDPDTHEKIYV